jgi:hypothetical protein
MSEGDIMADRPEAGAAVADAGQVIASFWIFFPPGALRAGNADIKTVIKSVFVGIADDLLGLAAQEAGRAVLSQEFLQSHRPQVPALGDSGKKSQIN